MRNKLCFVIFMTINLSYSQFKLINTDTTETKFYDYKNHIIKSFIYKKQYTTTQTGEELFVFFDSICDNNKQHQSVIYAATNVDKFYYYRDSLIIRNWNLNNTPLKNRDYFQLNIYLKSKEYSSLGISFVLNRKDTASNRVVIFKPDALTFYTSEIYSDTNFADTKLKSPLSYKLSDNSYIYLYFNDKNHLSRLYYILDDDKNLQIKFNDLCIPAEYGFRNNQNQSRIGAWYTYHKNGRISSEGEYSGSSFDENEKEIDIKKTGKWLYYTQQGCIDREEIWDDGKLISDVQTKNSKSKRRRHQ